MEQRYTIIKKAGKWAVWDIKHGRRASCWTPSHSHIVNERQSIVNWAKARMAAGEIF